MNDGNILVNDGKGVIVVQDAKFTILDNIDLVQGGQVVARVPATFDLTGVAPEWHEFIVQLAMGRRAQVMMPTDEQLRVRAAARPQPINRSSFGERFRKWRKGIFS